MLMNNYMDFVSILNETCMYDEVTLQLLINFDCLMCYLFHAHVCITWDEYFNKNRNISVQLLLACGVRLHVFQLIYHVYCGGHQYFY